MPTAYTSLLGLALPVQGELQGTWGDTVNNQITSLVEDAVANAATISVTAGNVTLTTTTGASNQARMSALILTGTPGVSRNIVVPSQAKAYVVINQSNAAIVIKGSATPGVSIAAGVLALVAWNGSDFALVAADTVAALGGLGANVATALSNSANSSSGFFTGSGTGTLTNKRINPRVSTTASTSSVAPDISVYDQYCFTAQAATLAINAPTGTPVDGNKLIFRILDNGTSQTLTWDATYTAIGVVLPTTTTISKMLYVGCIYNTANTRWDVVAVTTQA